MPARPVSCQGRPAADRRPLPVKAQKAVEFLYLLGLPGQKSPALAGAGDLPSRCPDGPDKAAVQRDMPLKPHQRADPPGAGVVNGADPAVRMKRGEEREEPAGQRTLLPPANAGADVKPVRLRFYKGTAGKAAFPPERFLAREKPHPAGGALLSLEKIPAAGAAAHLPAIHRKGRKMVK